MAHHFQVIALRKENVYKDADGEVHRVWRESKERILRYAAVLQKDAEAYGRDIYKREGIIAEIYEID